MSLFTKKGYLAVAQPEFKKIESTLKGGIALISQRVNLIAVPLLADYELDGQKLEAGKYMVVLRGNAGLEEWAKKVYDFEGSEFVLCPETAVIAVKKKE